jgi:hypothetical protein
VDLGAGGGVSAGRLYREADLALGVANFQARKPESIELTASAAAKMFDIFLQAAPEIIAAMPTLPACMRAGVGTEFFDASGNCTSDGITCLTGIPATATQVDLCNQLVQRASTPEKGRTLAVAAVAAAAHTCE